MKSQSQPEIYRYKAAKTRTKLSPTIRAALASDIIKPGDTHLDYGCGKGNDVKLLSEVGIRSSGYDPYYFPSLHLLSPANVVTLGFVLNVIECPVERDRTIAHAYSLAIKTLVVSAIVGTEKGATKYGDGVITKWNTFEKYYGAAELRQHVETVLGVRSQWIDQAVLAVPKVEVYKPLILDYEPASIKDALEELILERNALQQECSISEGAFLEKYDTVDKKTYYRLRSRFSNLPGKNGSCKCLHLGKEGSDRYRWGLDQLKRLDQILLTEQRITKLRQMLSVSSSWEP